MTTDPQYKPRLRPIEPVPVQQAGVIGLRDRSLISPVVLSLAEPGLFILSLMDGEHTLAQIEAEFLERYQQELAPDTLTDMVARLEDSLLLEGERFEAHYDQLLEEYRAAPSRPMPSAADLGVDGQAASLFGGMLAEATGPEESAAGTIVGLIAPHLDYPRGRSCYGAAYAVLGGHQPPDRFVILGTNHFGRGALGAVVGTGQDFSTPLGIARTDRAFLERIEARCGNLRRYEYDHLHEHSIELQVCWLQHLFGAEQVRIAAFLCPDPCGPTGTTPHNGEGVDLAEFAHVLGESIAEDGGSTIVIAGADFSHVGQYFGDARELDDVYLAEVRQRDHEVLACIESGDPEAFRQCVAVDDNPTHICSAGCMFTLLAALDGARATVLGYHQAVEQSVQNCVTCAAVVLSK